MDNWMVWAAGAVLLYFMLKPGVPADAKLSPAEVKDAMAKQKDLQLLDVRSQGEFSGGRLSGSKNLPLGDLGRRMAELSKDQPLIVYCRSGARSSAALKQLRGAGFVQAKHMQGGILAWHGAGYAVSR
jgi:rhodanese-related sulfurtransferase